MKIPTEKWIKYLNRYFINEVIQMVINLGGKKYSRLELSKKCKLKQGLSFCLLHWQRYQIILMPNATVHMRKLLLFIKDKNINWHTFSEETIQYKLKVFKNPFILSRNVIFRDLS